MAPRVYLVSGANRGIGLALVTQLAVREGTVVFAGARNLNQAQELQALAAKYPGKIHLVKLTSADQCDNAEAIVEIKETAGRVDVVIASAEISGSFYPTVEVPLDGMWEHFEVNVLGPLVLFQAS